MPITTEARGSAEMRSTSRKAMHVGELKRCLSGNNNNGIWTMKDARGGGGGGDGDDDDGGNNKLVFKWTVEVSDPSLFPPSPMAA